MAGFLGTAAPRLSDLSLIFILTLAIVAGFGGIQARRRRFSTHCPVMATAAFLNWIPLVLLMIPEWLAIASGKIVLAAGPFQKIPFLHGIFGAVTQLLMTYTVTRMYLIKRLPPRKPIWLMRTTIILWLLTVIVGVAVYVVSYVR